MDFVKKCKRVLGSSKRLHPENSGSGSYGRLTNKEKKNKSRVAPQGCVCVYVGPDRERFVIKIKIANHPSFKSLLDAAEREYGYTNDGPLWLPCDVDLFCEALAEMESNNQGSNLSCRYITGSVIDHYETLVSEITRKKNCSLVNGDVYQIMST